MLLFALAAANLRDADDDGPFDQPIPLLHRVPLAKSTFEHRLIGVVSAFAVIDLLMTAACVWKWLHRQPPPTSLSQRLFESAELEATPGSSHPTIGISH
jgi:hypothetical protein